MSDSPTTVAQHQLDMLHIDLALAEEEQGDHRYNRTKANDEDFAKELRTLFVERLHWDSD